MPYVTPDRRHELKPAQYTGRPPAIMQHPGDLAYLLAQACADYLRQNELSWRTIQDVLGSLDGVARDFWNEVGQPYEDAKRRTNGAIYPPVPSYIRES